MKVLTKHFGSSLCYWNVWGRKLSRIIDLARSNRRSSTQKKSPVTSTAVAVCQLFGFLFFRVEDNLKLSRRFHRFGWSWTTQLGWIELVLNKNASVVDFVTR